MKKMLKYSALVLGELMVWIAIGLMAGWGLSMLVSSGR